MRFAGTPAGWSRASCPPLASRSRPSRPQGSTDRIRPPSRRAWRRSPPPRARRKVVRRHRFPTSSWGFGGYVCIPVARAAEKTGVPVVLHEQNSVAGMANKYLARRRRRLRDLTSARRRAWAPPRRSP
ncbi:MAG: glycosyltransferase [Adlercreutzia equolifaciens]